MNDRSTNAARHQREVERIADQLRDAHRQGRRVHITKDSGHHVVPLPNDQRFNQTPVNISRLDQIISIDTRERRCVAEPGVTFSSLIARTLEHDLIPTVVPELEGITIGGAVAGCSIEAMSYRYGGFHDSCRRYEVISGDGQIISCSPEDDPDVFEMIHGSYGTLGLLSEITFELTPAKRYVHMEYRHSRSFEDFQQQLFDECAAGRHDFIDAIIHGPHHFVLCLGDFTDRAPYVSDYRRTNIFYRSTAERKADYIATDDYCFRYDADCHWLTRSVPPLQWRPVRWLLGRHILGSTNLIKWSKRLEKMLALKKRPEVVCDVFIPDGNFGAFWDWYQRDFDFYPLWIVPYRMTEPYRWVSPAFGAEMKASAEHGLMIDCAVYGKENDLPDVDYSQLLEDKTFELKGIKTLISRNHYDEERFWTIYNQPLYREIKGRLDPSGVFPDLYENFHRVD